MREERSVDGWIAHGRPVVVASGGRGRGVVGGGGEDVDADVRLHTLSAICCLFLLSPVAFAFAACMARPDTRQTGYVPSLSSRLPCHFTPRPSVRFEHRQSAVVAPPPPPRRRRCGGRVICNTIPGPVPKFKLIVLMHTHHRRTVLPCLPTFPARTHVPLRYSTRGPPSSSVRAALQ